MSVAVVASLSEGKKSHETCRPPVPDRAVARPRSGADREDPRRPAGGIGAHHLSRHSGPDGFGRSDRRRSRRRLLLTPRLSDSAADVRRAGTAGAGVRRRRREVVGRHTDGTSGRSDSRQGGRGVAGTAAAAVELATPRRARRPDVGVDHEDARRRARRHQQPHARVRRVSRRRQRDDRTHRVAVDARVLGHELDARRAGANCARTSAAFASIAFPRRAAYAPRFPTNPASVSRTTSPSSGTRGTRAPQEIRQ